jgi:hypothetical protein
VDANEEEDGMLRVGQCECCEGWVLARNLTAARVVRPTIAVRQRELESDPAIPGLEAPLVAYFCEDCVRAMREGPLEEAPAILRPGDPEFTSAPSRAAARGPDG